MIHKANTNAVILTMRISQFDLFFTTFPTKSKSFLENKQ